MKEKFWIHENLIKKKKQTKYIAARLFEKDGTENVRKRNQTDRKWKCITITFMCSPTVKKDRF